MKFELSSEHVAVRDQARALAQSIRGQATHIDRAGDVPTDVVQAMRAFVTGDRLGLVLAAEEVASASAAVAVSAVGVRDGAPLGLAGLRGVTELEREPEASIQLVLAAAALGVGKAAIDASLDQLRQSTAVPGADVEKPHWVVADAATDVEAARLLTYKAATTGAAADVALARLMACAAAERAVDAALRVTGPEALHDGSTLERLARDVRALSLVSGTEEQQRAAAADALFPR
jgi:alkylation response protein AidB-like acyl-CoA dehydrogenase